MYVNLEYFNIVVFLSFFLSFFPDLNVEHFQLFLFIFNNFSMAQRKALLTYSTKVLITVANATSVVHATPLAICRLLQLLDYFLHHLSKPPQDLFKQVCVQGLQI